MFLLNTNLDLQMYIVLYTLLYILIISTLLLILYHISANTQYVIQYYKQYSYYNYYFIYIVCLLLLIIAGIPPFSFFVIKILYCKYILIYTNFIYFIFFIYFILLMLYFYLKFIQLFFPTNILYNVSSCVSINSSTKVYKLSLMLIYIMLFFCIYYNDLILMLNYLLN